MVARIRIYLLVNTIIAMNWLLSKLVLLLASESVLGLAATVEDNHIVIKSNYCYLDDCFDDSGNGRQSLSMWKYRIKAED
jgi:hypothetical protein